MRKKQKSIKKAKKDKILFIFSIRSSFKDNKFKKLSLCHITLEKSNN